EGITDREQLETSHAAESINRRSERIVTARIRGQLGASRAWREASGESHLRSPECGRAEAGCRQSSGAFYWKVYLKLSIATYRSLVPAPVWHGLVIRLPFNSCMRYESRPCASGPGLVRICAFTRRWPTPQSWLSRLPKFVTSRRICPECFLPPIEWKTSCVRLTSMRFTIGLNTPLRSAYWPRWSRRYGSFWMYCSNAAACSAAV